MIGKQKTKQASFIWTSEQGYLMISTLFVLLLAGIITQSFIKISTNHLLQLNEIAATYQAKASLNMAEQIVRDQLDDTNQIIQSGKIITSQGEILIEKQAEDEYCLRLITPAQQKYTKNIMVDLPSIEPEELIPSPPIQ